MDELQDDPGPKRARARGRLRRVGIGIALLAGLMTIAFAVWVLSGTMAGSSTTRDVETTTPAAIDDNVAAAPAAVEETIPGSAAEVARAAEEAARDAATKAEVSMSTRPPRAGGSGAEPGARGDESERVRRIHTGRFESGSAPERPRQLENKLTWNYWLGRKSEALVPDIHQDALRIGAPAKLVFRLSSADLALSIPALKTLAGSPELMVAVRGAMADASKPDLKLDVLVQSVDAKKIRIAEASSRMPVVIDLDAMRAKLLGQGSAIEPGVQPLQAALEEAMIAQFVINFTPLQAGTHDIGVVVLDAETGFPLQTIIVGITAGKAWPGNVVAKTNGRIPDAANGPRFDFSLFLFDLGTVGASGEYRTLHAQLYFRDPGSGARDVLAWRTDTSLEGLVQSTKTFRDMVGSVSSGDELLVAGRTFGRSIFDPASGEGECAREPNCNVALRARKLIVAAARYGPEQLPPSMLVRVVRSGPGSGARFASPVIPIGAIGVTAGRASETVYLGERFALALLLADQEFETSASCPSQWYVALPRDEDYLREDERVAKVEGDPIADALVRLDGVITKLGSSSSLHRQSDNLAELNEWLEDRKGKGSYVLSYLGHHSVGRLFLDQRRAGISAGNVQRNFERSSIAILNACDSALPEITDGSPIGRLSVKRVDSTVATTSRISGELAAAYTDCLYAVLGDKRALTIGQAHALATQCLWNDTQSKRWGRHYKFLGSALKYILIGNPHQRICSPYQGAQK